MVALSTVNWLCPPPPHSPPRSLLWPWLVLLFISLWRQPGRVLTLLFFKACAIGNIMCVQSRVIYFTLFSLCGDRQAGYCTHPRVHMCVGTGWWGTHPHVHVCLGQADRVLTLMFMSVWGKVGRVLTLMFMSVWGKVGRVLTLMFMSVWGKVGRVLTLMFMSVWGKVGRVLTLMFMSVWGWTGVVLPSCS